MKLLLYERMNAVEGLCVYSKLYDVGIVRRIEEF